MELVKEMQLRDYPDAIAKLERQVIGIDEQILQLKESLLFTTNAVDRQIAEEQTAAEALGDKKTLSNDDKRRTRKQELLEKDADYINFSSQLRMAEKTRRELQADLNLLSSQFSVLKLEERRAIASIERQAALIA